MSESFFYHITENGKLDRVHSLDEVLKKVEMGGFIWLSYNNPTQEDLYPLIKPLNLHPLAIEDCIDDNQIPKVDDFPGNMQILFNTFAYTDKGLIINEIHLFCSDKYLVTIHHQDANGRNILNDLKRLIELDIGSSKKGPAFVMHTILDHIVDQKFLVLEVIEDELVKAEDAMIDDISNFNPSKMQRIRRELLALRKSLFHEREILVKICRRDFPYIPEDVIFHYHDIYDHLTKFFEITETYREIVTNLMQMNLSLLNNQMAKFANQTNVSVRRLTLITTIFMPLTLLSGIGGMSEWSMMTGSENWRISFPVFLLAMAVIGITSYFILKWLEQKELNR